MIGQQKITEFYISKTTIYQKICNDFLFLFFKLRNISELSWNFSEKYQCPGLYFFLQSSRCISNELLLLLLLSHFSRVQLCATPQMAAHQVPPSLGFSSQEHWSGLPFPSPMCESEVVQSCLALHDPMNCSLPGSSIHGIFPGKSTGVGCHCLLCSNEHSYLKTTRPYEDFLLLSVLFPFLVLPFHLVYVFQFLHIDFLLFFLKPLSILAKTHMCVYIYIYIYDPCILASNITVERLESLLFQ